MAEITTPIITDETGQDIIAAIQSLSGATIREVHSGTSSLIDGVSDLPSGNLYLQYDA